MTSSGERVRGPAAVQTLWGGLGGYVAWSPGKIPIRPHVYSHDRNPRSRTRAVRRLVEVGAPSPPNPRPALADKRDNDTGRAILKQSRPQFSRSVRLARVGASETHTTGGSRTCGI